MRVVALISIIVLTTASILSADSSNRIYGRLHTRSGDSYEGFIRWDKNEASWVDILNGSKELERSDDKYERRRSRRNTFFGIRIGASDNWFARTAASGIRFGHIARLEPSHGDAIELELKSGQRIELSGGSTDIGDDIRQILIEDLTKGEIELIWDDLDYIEFSSGPADYLSRQGERLYGVLTTRRGDRFEGWVCWDIDEVLSEDILNGEEHGQTRNIPFSGIAKIERYSSNGAKVVFTDGEEAILKGTNDVNDGNRGILILDPNLGQVEVSWREFESLEFRIPQQSISYDLFDGGRELVGTVYTDDGEKYTGRIHWDDDESYTWEMLNGESSEIEYDIEFSQIASIERNSRRSALVTLRDGRQVELTGSNDVNSENKGIVIVDEGGEKMVVDWFEFSRVVFK